MSSATKVTIGVGVDGSAESRIALDWACDLAKRAGAEVHAYSMWSVPSAVYVPIGGPAAPGADIFEDAAIARLKETVGACQSDVTIHEHVVFGGAGPALAEASADHDLMVVGKTGRGRVSRMIVGSVARHLARHAKCPVVLATHPSVEPQAIVAVDGSPLSKQALMWAIEVPNVNVVAVYSHDERPLDELPIDHALRRELDGAAEVLLDKVIAEVVAEAGVDADDIQREVRTGDPRTTIYGHDESMTVVGARGQRGFAGVFVGSFADYAINHCDGTLVVCQSD